MSLSPTSTEVLFAVGAGPQVVAVDNQSNYPTDAPITDLTGFEPNLEAIAGYDADLVVVMYDPGEVIDGLEAIGIPVIMHAAAGRSTRRTLRSIRSGQPRATPRMRSDSSSR